MRRLRGQRSVIDTGTGEIRPWTDADLAAAAARHWFSRDMVYKIENRTPARGRRPSARTLRAICDVLECDPADLMPDGAELPEGDTEARALLLDYYAALRAFALERGIIFRYPPRGGRPESHPLHPGTAPGVRGSRRRAGLTYRCWGGVMSNQASNARKRALRQLALEATPCLTGTSTPRSRPGRKTVIRREGRR